MSTSCAPRSTTSADLGQPGAERSETRRERAGDARDLHARPLQLPERDRHEMRVEADGRHRGDRGVDRVRAHRLRAHRDDLADGVSPLERREVHAADREVERPQLRLPLDRTLRERGGALLEPDRVDRGHPREEPGGVLGRVERQTGARAFDLGCLGHRPPWYGGRSVRGYLRTRRRTRPRAILCRTDLGRQDEEARVRAGRGAAPSGSRRARRTTVAEPPGPRPVPPGRPRTPTAST